MNTTHDVSHVIENVSVRCYENFIWRRFRPANAATVAVASEENSEGDEEDDEAAALAMALAMSVNLNLVMGFES